MNSIDYHGWGYSTGEVASYGDLNRDAWPKSAKTKARDRLISDKSVMDYSMYLTGFLAECERVEMREGTTKERWAAALKFARAAHGSVVATKQVKAAAEGFIKQLYHAVGIGALERDGISTIEDIETA